MAYEIRIQNHLDTAWTDWFDGWQITNLQNGEVLLTSASADQSALHGALNKIRDLNLKLVSVMAIEDTDGVPERAAHRLETGTEKRAYS